MITAEKSDEPFLFSYFMFDSGQEMLTIRRPIQMSTLAEAAVEQETVNLTANNDWRIAQGSSVRLDQIPTWIEQIHLKGIETVHVSFHGTPQLYCSMCVCVCV